tara:strand:+ start:489 stop:632 length:144 start_codon:yes stop_codon:yes gene_type:complete
MGVPRERIGKLKPEFKISIANNCSKRKKILIIKSALNKKDFLSMLNH